MPNAAKFRCDNCSLLLAVGENGVWSVAHCFSIRVREIDDWLPVLPGQRIKLLKRIAVKCVCQSVIDLHANRK